MGSIEPLNYSPIQLDVTASPTPRSSARLRLEYDSILGTMPSLSANGTAQLTRWVGIDAGWGQRTYVTNPLANDRFVNATVNVRAPNSRYSGSYSFFYDLGRSTLAENRDGQGNPRPTPEPQVWVKRVGEGRIFVATLGHDEQSQRDPRFVTLMSNGIRWAAGRLPDASPAN